MAILNDSDFVEVEGRYYANPQVALDESNKFIDNLRSTQQANNQQIQTDTYNLGAAVPSNLGGLTSPVTDGNGGAEMNAWLATKLPVVYGVLKHTTDTRITDDTLIGQLNDVHEWLTRYGYSSTVAGDLPIIIDKTSL